MASTTGGEGGHMSEALSYVFHILFVYQERERLIQPLTVNGGLYVKCNHAKPDAVEYWLLHPSAVKCGLHFLAITDGYAVEKHAREPTARTT